MRIRYIGFGGIWVNGHRERGEVFEIGDAAGRLLIAEGRAERVEDAPEPAPAAQPRTADPAVKRRR